MREADPFYQLCAVRTLDFVAALQAAADGEAVLELLRKEIAQFGFHSLLITAVDQREFSQRVIARSWPPGWVAMYEKENMSPADPVRRRLWRSIGPFLWSDTRYDPQREAKSKLIMERASDFRMNEGLCVPVVHKGSPVAAINISGEKPELAPGGVSALHIISLFAYNRFRALTEPPSFPSDKLLTEREREVLKWVSAGKSDWDISTILSISERTARAHVTNAARKLNAANRPAAIVEALRLGAISL